jgi:Zn-dependent protease
MEISFLFTIIILIMSVVIHEVSHGSMAYLLGDPTAKNAGRLTLNPLAHLDLMGSLVVPLMAYFTAGLMFGWAKPVPYNPYNLRNQKYGDALVAVAGPASNLLVALVFGLLLRFHFFVSVPNLISAFQMIVVINLVLALFNLIPVPPLDGSKILFSFLPYRYEEFKESLERYSIFLLLFVIFFLWKFLFPLISFVFSLITGINLI